MTSLRVFLYFEGIKEKEVMMKVLISEEQIRKRIRELAEEIRSDYEGKRPLFIGVLKGALSSWVI